MSDDPRVTVPAELVGALREALAKWRTDKPTRVLVRSVENLLEAAEPKCPKCGIGKLSTSGGRTPLKCIRASCNHVVDAAEQPDGGQHPKFEAFKAEQLKNPEVKAAYDEARERNAPVSEALCRCGHPSDVHDRGICGDCDCHNFVFDNRAWVAPVPVTDEQDACSSGRPSATSDGLSDEAEAEDAWHIELTKAEVQLLADWGVPPNTRALVRDMIAARLAGFRAARQEDA